MVHFVGAGPGAPDLITQRGAAFTALADRIIWCRQPCQPCTFGAR